MRTEQCEHVFTIYCEMSKTVRIQDCMVVSILVSIISLIDVLVPHGLRCPEHGIGAPAPVCCACLTRDGRWSTYDISVLKLYNVSFRGRCARRGNTLKLPSPTKVARLGHYPPASQAGSLAGPVFYV